MNQEESAAVVLERVKQAGAEGDLIIDEGESLTLKTREGELEEHKVSSLLIFGLRVVKDDRVGTAYSEASDADALASMVDQALLNATFAKVEPDEKIAGNSGQLRTDDNVLCPSDTPTIDDKILFVQSMENELAAKDKIKNVPSNGLSDGINQRHVFTTGGLCASTKQRHCSAASFALMEEGDKNVMEGVVRVSRQFSDLNYQEIVEGTYDRCLSLLDGTAIPTKHYDVIFDEDNQTSLFGIFSSMFSAQSAKDGVNPMRDKIGEQIADTRLNLSDQPLLTDGFGYALFDAEGTATKTTPLIVEGQLRTLVHNSATATHFDVITTGHASRSPKSTLGVSLHQMHIDKGTDSPSSLFAREYLLITDLSGLHSGANPISGQFSFGASGYLMKEGERIQPVRNITVAGNFYDMLKKISAIGDELYWDQYRGSLMPRIRFSDVAISG
ncbi:MAG TPA: TldD/PmbA family protein [Gammaproteobacteria bacterium]|nr:TldD/PmbA family protein [Gammaproteobacteria bacterium]|tara:strand:+ start:32 stop:1360 length:1329 start_codon:yes stop_codon:yes gene_type:complete